MIKKGIGISCAFQGSNTHFGHHDVSSVLLEVSDDNMFLFHVAASDVGQGLESTLLTIVSEAFGELPVERIRWSWPKTSSPDGGVTGASRQTTMTGNAVYNACKKLKQVIDSVVSEMMDVSPSEGFKISGDYVVYSSGQKILLSEVLEQARKEGRKLEVLGEFTAPLTTMIDEQGRGEPINQFGYATCVAEVEVDTETGELKVLNISAYHDAGRIINPIGAESQVEGGIVMGLGYATSEDFIMNGGKHINVGFTNYLIPSVNDSPAPAIKVHFIDSSVPMGELGVKGLAELPNTVIAPAITNAIYNATGARIYSLPASPERIFRAIQEADQEHED